MEYKQHFDVSTFPWWSGAVDTISEIRKARKMDDLQGFLEEYYMGKIPTMTDINDLLWFNDEFVFKSLGMEVEDGSIP
jgi:hypothetical protein